LEESKKPPENISKHLKQAFILSLPVLIIGVIELFGIDVHDLIVACCSSLNKRIKNEMIILPSQKESIRLSFSVKWKFI
jgi:hypothetical protein